jgi:radical SAM superfamily enzyme YgiQ (UPF0313 family)
MVFVQPRTGFKGHTWEALGLGYIISSIKEKYPDMLVEFYSGFFDSDETIVTACRDAQVVCFGCTSPQFKHAVFLADRVKTPDNLVVVGGIHATALPYQPLKEKNIDVVVQGEGERAILEIVRRFVLGEFIEKDWKAGVINDVDGLPFPDRNIIKNERNIQQAYKDNRKRITSILSSRGCPYACSFCCSHCLWGRTPRLRSPRNIMDEYRHLVDCWKIDFVKFADDTFTISKQRVKDFCWMKYDEGVQTPFGANAHVNTIDESVLKYLVLGNCQELWYGVESGSPKILNSIHKNTDVERIKEVFRLTKDHGIRTRAYFLLGTPEETLEDIQMTEGLCNVLEPDEVGFSMLAPFPCNEYFEYDIMKDWDWSGFDEYNNSWISNKNLTNEELRQEQQRLVNKYSENISFRQRMKT